MHIIDSIIANALLYVRSSHNLHHSLVVNGSDSGVSIRLPQFHYISTTYHPMTSLCLNFLIYKWGNNIIQFIELF